MDGPKKRRWRYGASAQAVSIDPENCQFVRLWDGITVVAPEEGRFTGIASADAYFEKIADRTAVGQGVVVRSRS